MHPTPFRARGSRLGSGDACGELVLIFDFGEFIAQAGGFGVIFLRLEMETHGAKRAKGIHNFSACTGVPGGLFHLGGEVFFLPGVEL